MLVHGFTQTGAVWATLAGLLADSYEVLAPDAPGHGGSTGVTAVNIAEAAALVAAAGGSAIYVGYSMGGRICLQAALDHPHRFRGLVLVSATGGIEDPQARAARRGEDEGLADRLDPPDRAGDPLTTAAFLEEWLAQPLFEGLPREAADLDARLANSPAGLAASLRSVGTGAMEPLWDRLGELQLPVLVVAGARDEKFVAIAERLAGAIAGATLQVVEGAGHAVPFEQPERFAAVLRSFVDACAERA